MRLHSLLNSFRWIPIILVLMSSGCEVGSRWFSMSSDSPMPWLGFDLLPRRKTTQILPHSQPQDLSRESTSRVSLREYQPTESRERVWSKELHLPSIPVLFETFQSEELTFERE